MCGKSPKKPPPVVERDPVAEQAKAESDAQVKANLETAMKRRRRNRSGQGMAAMAIKAANLGGGNTNKSLLTQARPLD